MIIIQFSLNVWVEMKLFRRNKSLVWEKVMQSVIFTFWGKIVAVLATFLYLFLQYYHFNYITCHLVITSKKVQQKKYNMPTTANNTNNYRIGYNGSYLVLFLICVPIFSLFFNIVVLHWRKFILKIKFELPSRIWLNSEDMDEKNIQTEYRNEESVWK